MEQFMFPPQAGMQGELPPGMPPPAQPSPVAMIPPPQEVALAPPPQPQAVPPSPALYPEAAPPSPAQNPQVQQQVAVDEGAVAPSATGDGFFDKLRSDPKMSQAMLMMGMRMMQGPRRGQNEVGLVGDAMMAAATAHNMLKYNEGEQVRKDQEFGLKTRESESRMASQGAQTAQTLQETSQKAELFPDAKAKIAQEVRNLRKQERVAEAEALIKEAKAGNIKTELDLENSVRRANITQSNAAAGASGASARASNALTDDRQFSTGLKKEQFDPKTTPERMAQIQKGYQTDDPASRAAGAKQNQIQELIRERNPEATPAEIASMTLDYMGTQKGERIIALKSLIDNGTDDQRAAALEEMQTLVTAKKGRGGPTAAAGTAQGTDMSKWEKVDGWALKPGADRKLKSSWVQVK